MNENTEHPPDREHASGAPEEPRSAPDHDASPGGAGPATGAAHHQGATAGPQQAASAPPPPEYRKRLTRRRDGKVFAGVCSGLGAYFDVDPIVFRLGFIVISLFGAAGVVLYVLAALFIPEEGRPDTPGERLVKNVRSRSWIGTTLIVIAAIIVLGIFAGTIAAIVGPDPTGFWNPSVAWAIVLVGLGVLLLRGDNAPSRTAPPPVPPQGAAPPSQAYGPPSGPGQGAMWPPAQPIAQPQPSGGSSALVWFTLAAGFIVMGLTAFGENLGLFDLDAQTYFALFLAVIGLGLIVGAWWGRSMTLIVLGVLLLPVVLVASVVDVPLQGSIGETVTTVPSPAALRDSYDLLAGERTLDLTDFRRWPAEPVALDLNLVAGRFTVLVPPNVDIETRGHFSGGLLVVDDRERSGSNFNAEMVDNAGEGAVGAVEIDLRGGFGQVDVRRAGLPARSAESPERPAPERNERRDERRRENREREGSRP